MNSDQRVGILWVVTTGFVRLMTHPKVLTHPLDPAAALDLVEDWFRYPHVSAINPGSKHLDHLRQSLTSAGAGADLVTDAHIASLALDYQAEVNSNDTDFARFSGLRRKNPMGS